ncbi:acyltransferase family protein [Paenibacillus turpanensis]|uniref:acyltransferase family protein n=1 Tax=Paenibacillus turpanensis TaxID=2689078 RepID=UPI00140C4DA9|nr:acyltransferase [Paenibacillus turpanensis]
MAERDRGLDIYRGLIMLYIVGVIHVLFWYNPFETTLKSFLLFEMAIIFFITGASQTYSRPKSLLSFYYTRYGRILIPYFVYSIVCLLLIFVMAERQGTFLEGYTQLEVIRHWLDPFGGHPSNVAYIAWHIWFVPVYLIVVLFTPLAYSIFQRAKGFVRVLPAVFLAGVVYWSDFHYTLIGVYEYVKFLAFYLFWVYIGFYYRIIVEKAYAKWVILALALLSFAAMYFLFQTGIYPYDMQYNKFPPKLIFLFFCFGMFGLLIFGTPIYKGLYRIPGIKQVIDQYSNYSLTVYLYHPFAFFAVSMLFRKVPLLQMLTANKIVLTAVYFVMTVVLVYLLPFIFGRFERVKLPYASKL